MTGRSEWKRMMFKGNKVWVHVDDDQKPVMRGNKVLVKYQLDQDHEYWVRREAVELIDPTRLARKAPKKKRGRGSPARKGQEVTPYEPPAKTIVVHTDGAASGNPGPAGIGVVLRFGAHLKEISNYIGIATNNIAELTAIKTALQAIRTTEMTVHLYTDSQYCYGLLTLGWKPKRNEKLVEAIKKLMARFRDIKIFKVDAHAGINDNERADSLAREALKGR